MSLNKENKEKLRNLLNLIKIDEVTSYPISNVKDIPFRYIKSEIFLKTSKQNFSFTIEEAIAASNHTQTVITLASNGMHYYYTPTSSKNMLWIPDVYATTKELDGTIVVMQEFPNDGKCQTKYMLAQNSKDASLDEYRDKDVIIFNNANFYLEKATLKHLTNICNNFWQQELIKNKNGLSILNNS